MSDVARLDTNKSLLGPKTIPPAEKIVVGAVETVPRVGVGVAVNVLMVLGEPNNEEEIE